MSRITDMLKEPSTYAGLAAAVLGAGQVLDFAEAPRVAEAITEAAPAVASNDWLGLLAVVLGAIAAWLKERR